MAESALIAIGGNSLIREDEHGEASQIAQHLRRTASAVVDLLRDGLRLVITHGNGPQVGAALLRSEIASDRAYQQSLDLCDAATQGEIGYELTQALENALTSAGLNIPVASVITQTIVRRDDPAFSHPTKPIGTFYTEDEARSRSELFGWHMARDRQRGYRRVVPSPDPVEIVEIETLRRLVASGTLVVAAGGGGIPVIRTAQGLEGVEAVIDKDLASSLLATQLGCDLFLITTDVEHVFIDYQKPRQRPISTIHVEELEILRDIDQFPPGNMGPKIEAVIRFLRAGGTRAVITDCDHLHDALHGLAGTQILPTRRRPSRARICEEDSLVTAHR